MAFLKLKFHFTSPVTLNFQRNPLFYPGFHCRGGVTGEQVKPLA